jgi:hypothetical protein
MKLLNQQKLSLIFQLQLHQVYRLFQLTGGRFRFDDFSELQDRILTIPWLEMTGNRLKTTEVTMHALRLMENWDHFTNQLPEPSQALKRIVAKPHLKLTAFEHQLWDLADGQMSLLSIAKITQQPLSTVQITAFRLMSVGLIDQVFKSSYDWKKLNPQKVRPNLSSQLYQEHLGNVTSNDTSLLQTLGEMFKNKIS